MQMFLRCLFLEPLLVSRHRSLTLEYGERDSEIEKLKDCFDFIFPSSSAPVVVPLVALHPTALLSPLSATLLPLSLSPCPLGEGVESLERAKLSLSGSRLSLPHPLLPLGRAMPSPGEAPIVFPDASNDLLETMRGRAPTREGTISCFLLFLLPSLWYDVSVDNG